MRLFIAIDFSEKVKDALMASSDALREASVRGTFVPRSAMHLTLEFLGDVPQSRVEDVKAAMDASSAGKFDITVEGAGAFRRDGGDVWWVGVCPSAELTALYARLHKALASAGFKTEERPFRPHVTLARRVVTGRGFDARAFGRAVAPVSFTASEMCLMLSELRPEGPKYTKLYRKGFF